MDDRFKQEWQRIAGLHVKEKNGLQPFQRCFVESFTGMFTAGTLGSTVGAYRTWYWIVSVLAHFTQPLSNIPPTNPPRLLWCSNVQIMCQSKGKWPLKSRRLNNNPVKLVSIFNTDRVVQLTVLGQTKALTRKRARLNKIIFKGLSSTWHQVANKRGRRVFMRLISCKTAMR